MVNLNIGICLYFSEDEGLVCENVTLALDYKFYWKGNGITNITLTRIVGAITLNTSGKFPSRWSRIWLITSHI